ncbi:MAG: putative nucleotide kinase [Rhodobacteraceae bacterium HLUCCA08]|nr:MAG: putative nucleotide kinase [Rhodobacteraceae bacterium HLUCCA08]
MNIAYTMAPGRGDTDLVLQKVAQALVARGLRPAGTAQVNTERPDAGPCDMDVIVLPDGPRIRISQSLGSASRGCRLDPEALEGAVGLVQGRLPGSDCLIVNKFGKHEAEGRGFRAVIAEALDLGLPVLVGVNALNLPAFEAFTGGLARPLAPDETALIGWLSGTIGRARQVA